MLEFIAALQSSSGAAAAPARTDLTHLWFLLPLPFDTGLPNGHCKHVPDDQGAAPLAGWEGFDLGAYLGLGPPAVIGVRSATILCFRYATVPDDDYLGLLEKAWPDMFAAWRRERAWWQRWWYSRPLRWLRSLRLPRPRRSRSMVIAHRVVPPPAEGFTPEWRDEQFEFAIRKLNDELVGIASVMRNRNPNLGTIAPADLPAGIFWQRRDLRAHVEGPGVPWAREFLPLHDLVPQVQPRLTTEELNVASWIAASWRSPYMLPGELLLGAWRSYYRMRNTYAVVEAGTAIETLVTAAVRELGGAAHAPFKNRAKDHFAGLLNFSRDVEHSNDALGAWWQTGYALRNRVAHEGYQPDHHEAGDALDTAEALLQEADQRLRAHPHYAGELPHHGLPGSGFS